MWQDSDLGQTSISVGCRWVYNQEKEGIELLNGTYFKFFKRPFPDEITVEWWVVDLLNNYLYAAISFEQARPRLAEKLRKKEIDYTRLLQLSEVYGNERVKKFVYSVCWWYHQSHKISDGSVSL